MPKDVSFEALLHLAQSAYERKTGKDFKYVQAYPIETYSNLKLWKK